MKKVFDALELGGKHASMFACTLSDGMLGFASNLSGGLLGFAWGEVGCIKVEVGFVWAGDEV